MSEQRKQMENGNGSKQGREGHKLIRVRAKPNKQKKKLYIFVGSIVGAALVVIDITAHSPGVTHLRNKMRQERGCSCERNCARRAT